MSGWLFRVSAVLVSAAASSSTLPALSLRGGAAEPVQLISGSGELLTSAAASAAPAGSAVSVVASIGGQHRGRRLLNAVFGTSFGTELQLGAQDAANAGAWVATAPSAPGMLVLESRPVVSSEQQRSAADACKLTSFSLAVADALIMHSPCVAPTAALVRESYERVFSHHIATMPSSESRTMLVHVSDPEGGLSEAAVRAACQDAWDTATAATEFKGKAFSDLFDLEVVSLPGREDDDGFDEAVATLRAKLGGKLGGKLGKSAFAEAASSAWSAVGNHLNSQPSEQWMTERYLAARAYEEAYGEGQVQELPRWHASHTDRPPHAHAHTRTYTHTHTHTRAHPHTHTSTTHLHHLPPPPIPTCTPTCTTPTSVGHLPLQPPHLPVRSWSSLGRPSLNLNPKPTPNAPASTSTLSQPPMPQPQPRP